MRDAEFVHNTGMALDLLCEGLYIGVQCTEIQSNRHSQKKKNFLLLFICMVGYTVFPIVISMTLHIMHYSSTDRIADRQVLKKNITTLYILVYSFIVLTKCSMKMQCLVLFFVFVYFLANAF